MDTINVSRRRRAAGTYPRTTMRPGGTNNPQKVSVCPTCRESRAGSNACTAKVTSGNTDCTWGLTKPRGPRAPRTKVNVPGAVAATAC